MSTHLDDIADSLPTGSGVYLWKDRKGRVLYVGKAVNVRARVRQYLSGHDGRTMVPFLVHQASDIEVVATNTEKEALLLENTLIKKHRPRFNVKLVDDKNFLHLRLDLTEAWPRYRMVRRIGSDGARYFGPFASAQKARETLAFLHRIFPLRSCSDAVLHSRTRPCLMFQLQRCVAPCVDRVDKVSYDQIARRSTALLEGRSRDVLHDLEARMLAHAESEAFEEAARLRDLIGAVKATVERQQVIDPKRADRDVWGLSRDGFTVGVAVLPIREGALSEPHAQVVRGAAGGDDELLSSLLNTTYFEGAVIPAEILVPVRPADVDALEAILSERAGRKVRVAVPERGDKVKLLDLATENARLALARKSDVGVRRQEALAELARVLRLPAPPRRMECFDNSHLGGDDPVAAMVVFIDGEPSRDLWRKYRIKTAMGGDDYAGMKEILGRRFRRGLAEGDLPDLLVIDGGKGQVAVAVAVLADLGLTGIPLIGLSKPRTEHARGDRGATDKIVQPGVLDPIRLSAHHPALRLLQHLRDETHKHAVGYQRKVRSKATLISALEAIPGVGAARRRALLQHLGSVEAVAEATVATLADVPGIGAGVAQKIHDVFHGAPADGS
jgi:excinuclease ABC subunit C